MVNKCLGAYKRHIMHDGEMQYFLFKWHGVVYVD